MCFNDEAGQEKELEREEKRTMLDINEQIKNKVLLITGGTGSFGSTVLRHFITSPVAEIRVFSRDEK